MTNPAPRSTEIVTAGMSQAAIDAGLRQFMISIYNYMASGLALTGIVACGAAETGLYASLIDTPMLFWGVTLAPLALVFQDVTVEVSRRPNNTRRLNPQQDPASPPMRRPGTLHNMSHPDPGWYLARFGAEPVRGTDCIHTRACFG